MTNLVLGASGLVGSALMSKLTNSGEKVIGFTSRDADLCNFQDTFMAIRKINPTRIFMAAGLVGGLADNANRPAEYLHENMLMGFNVVNAAYRLGVSKLLYYSSSCAYPKNINQPMVEEDILSGKLEETNEGYALAKISTQKLCEYYNRQYGTNFVTVIPCNLYGFNDKFDLEKGHFVGSLITKFVKALRNKESAVEIWGDGTQRRELMHADDLAEASLFVLDNYTHSEPINVGWGTDYSIAEVAEMIKFASGYSGDIVYDSTKPIGMKTKVLDCTKMNNLGWWPKTPLNAGLDQVIGHYMRLPNVR